MRYEVKDVYQAVELAMELKEKGECNLFRGQADADWPVVSSLMRLQGAKWQEAVDRFNRFYSWLAMEAAASGVPDDEDSALAIAQHYGIHTPLIDFTRSPHVAAFFATHTEGKKKPPRGKIILLDSVELTDLTEKLSTIETYKGLREHLRIIDCFVPGLWRLDAQHGTFLEARLTTSSLDFIWTFDEIVFPHISEYSHVSKTEIYPSRKSEIEHHIESYFSWEDAFARSLAFEELAQSLPAQNVLRVKASIDTDVFCDEIPDHLTWPVAGEWLANRGTSWQGNLVRALDLRVPDELSFDETLRTVKQRMSAFSPGSVLDYGVSVRTRNAVTTKMLKNYIEGVRFYQFTEIDVHKGIGTLIALNNSFKREKRTKNDFLESLGFFEIEFGTTSGISQRSYCGQDKLLNAVRSDINLYVDENDPNMSDLKCLLLSCPFPQKLFDFNKFSAVFCSQILPVLVFLDKKPVFNIISLNTFGIP